MSRPGIKKTLCLTAAFIFFFQNGGLCFAAGKEEKFLYGFLEEIYRKQKDLDKEETLYKKAVKAFPDDGAELQYKLAGIYNRRGDFKKAIKLLDEITEKFPVSKFGTRAQLRKARIYCYGLGEYKRASRIYKKLSGKVAGYWVKSAALLGIAETYEFRHKYKKAVRLYRKLVEKYPGRSAAYDAGLRADAIQNGNDYGGKPLKLFALEYQYWRGEKFGESIEICRKIVTEYPDSYLASSAQYYIGYMFQFNIDDYEKAVSEYRKVLENYDESKRAPFALYRIGECRGQQGRTNLKNEINRQVLNKYPDSLPAKWIRIKGGLYERFF